MNAQTQAFQLVLDHVLKAQSADYSAYQTIIDSDSFEFCQVEFQHIQFRLDDRDEFYEDRNANLYALLFLKQSGCDGKAMIEALSIQSRQATSVIVDYLTQYIIKHPSEARQIVSDLDKVEFIQDAPTHVDATLSNKGLMLLSILDIYAGRFAPETRPRLADWISIYNRKIWTHADQLKRATHWDASAMIAYNDTLIYLSERAKTPDTDFFDRFIDFANRQTMVSWDDAYRRFYKRLGSRRYYDYCERLKAVPDGIRTALFAFQHKCLRVIASVALNQTTYDPIYFIATGLRYAIKPEANPVQFSFACEEFRKQIISDAQSFVPACVVQPHCFSSLFIVSDISDSDRLGHALLALDDKQGLRVWVDGLTTLVTSSDSRRGDVEALLSEKIPSLEDQYLVNYLMKSVSLDPAFAKSMLDLMVALSERKYHSTLAKFLVDIDSSGAHFLYRAQECARHHDDGKTLLSLVMTILSDRLKALDIDHTSFVTALLHKVPRESLSVINRFTAFFDRPIQVEVLRLLVLVKEKRGGAKQVARLNITETDLFSTYNFFSGLKQTANPEATALLGQLGEFTQHSAANLVVKYRYPKTPDGTGAGAAADSTVVSRRRLDFDTP